MTKKIPNIYKFILYLSLVESCFITKSSNAFFPKINEPNQQELKSTAIQIGKTAIQLIQFGQYHEAIKLLRLAVKLNPNEIDLWRSLGEGQIRANKNYEALSSFNKAIELKPKEHTLYLRKSSIYMNLNDPKKAKVSIKKSLSINKKKCKGIFSVRQC